jgi:chromosome segregation ATPase
MIDALRTQLEEVRQQMRSKNRNNPVEAAEYVELKGQEDALIEQITAAQREEVQQEIEAQSEVRLHEDIPFSVSGVELGKLDAEVIELIEAIVHIDRRKFLKEHGEEVLILKTALKNSEDREKAAIEDARQAQEEATKAKSETVDIRYQLEKMTEQRDNAARLLLEREEEIARLSSHITDLRNQIHAGVRNELKVIDIDATADQDDEAKLADIMRRLEEKKQRQREQFLQDAKRRIYVYDVEPLNLMQTRFRAKLATTGEPVEYGSLERIYVDVSEKPEVLAEERARFLAEQATQDNGGELQTDNSLQVGVELPSSSFLVTQDAALEADGIQDGSGVQDVHAQTAQGSDGTVGEDVDAVGAQSVSREEFEALQRRVERIERYANIEGAA